MVPKVVGPRLLSSWRSRQSGLVPDAVEDLPDGRRGELVAGRGDEEGAPRRAEPCGRYLVAAGQDLGELAGWRQPARAVALGGHDVEVPVTQVSVFGSRQAGFPAPAARGSASA